MAAQAQSLEAAAHTPDDVDYAFVLLAHLIASDTQIHADEVRRFKAIAHEHGASDASLQEAERVLAVDDGALSIDVALRQVPNSRRDLVLELLATAAWADGHLADEERTFLLRVAEAWSVSSRKLERILRDSAPDSDSGGAQTAGDREPTLSLASRLVGALDRVLSSNTVDALADRADAELGRVVRRARSKLLLAGPGYDEAIVTCAAVSLEDYAVAERALHRGVETLEKLKDEVDERVSAISARARRKDAEHSKDVVALLESIRTGLDQELLGRISRLQASLFARHRSLNSFTVAFMGRTKAGKSTLHAVLTGEGWEAIGVGKQRTTRLNRVYDWKRVRIIDTPGIGAPGGATDEETARSVIDEADLIVYVVTDDSQQPAEFKFLGVLRERLKPVLILLNVKKDISDADRLARFLRRPDRAFRSVAGHQSRIQRYATEQYGQAELPIIPVHLLAAQLGRKEGEDSDTLMRASRVDDFLDRVRVSILQEGVLRRSQTLLGSTALDLRTIDQWLDSSLREVDDQIGRLAEVRSRVKRELGELVADGAEQLEVDMATVWAAARKAIAPFAESHWDKKKAELEAGWKKKMKALKIERRLKEAGDRAVAEFQAKTEELLREVGAELQLLEKLGGRSMSVDEQDSSELMRSLMRFGGPLITIAGGIAGILQLSWAWPVVIVGIAITLLARLFKSREKKRKEAAQAISGQLREQIDDQAQESVTKATASFRKSGEQVVTSCDSYFGHLEDALRGVRKAVRRGGDDLSEARRALEFAYAVRVVDWAEDESTPALGTRPQDRLRSVLFDGTSLELELKEPIRGGGRGVKAASQVLQMTIAVEYKGTIA